MEDKTKIDYGKPGLDIDLDADMHLDMGDNKETQDESKVT